MDIDDNYCKQCEKSPCALIKITPCAYCLNLGCSMPSVVFYTLTPDPYNNDYVDKLPDKQYKWLKFKLQQAVADIKKKYPTAKYTVHWEFNKNGEVHAHGIIAIDDVSILNYQLHTMTIQKIFHRYIGRPKVASYVSSKTVWVKDMYHVARYVNKENVFQPDHSDMRRDITEWLL